MDDGMEPELKTLAPFLYIFKRIYSVSTYNRISARRGSPVALQARFLQGGVEADPHYIYRVEIYKGSVTPNNVVEIIQIDSPDSSDYPYPLIQDSSSPGSYTLEWDVPSDLEVPNVYFDVWYFYSTDPRTGSSSADEYSENTNKLIKFCNRFWVYPEQWYVDGGLQTLKFGFEPLDLKFSKPEVRPLEIGLMPLPLYDYDYNLVAPLIPYIEATISISTLNCEPIIVNRPMTIKLRQGAFRSNPFVLSYLLDTSSLLMGTYKFKVTLKLPDGTTRVSPDYHISIG